MAKHNLAHIGHINQFKINRKYHSLSDEKDIPFIHVTSPDEFDESSSLNLLWIF